MNSIIRLRKRCFLVIFLITSTLYISYAQKSDHGEIESYYPTNISSNILYPEEEFWLGNGKYKASIKPSSNDGKLYIKFYCNDENGNVYEKAYITYEFTPCDWNFAFSKTLDLKDGILYIKNGYVNLSVFFDTYEPTLWIDGEANKMGKVVIEAIDQNNLASISEISDSYITEKFTLKSSLTGGGLSFQKSHKRTKRYWNDVWERSYIVSSAQNDAASEIISNYNWKRWKALSLLEMDQSMEFLLRCGDIDFIRTYLTSQRGTNNTPEYIHLLMEFYNFTGDESFLFQDVIPEYERITDINDINLTSYIIYEVSKLPSHIMVSPKLYSKITAFQKENKISYNFNFTESPELSLQKTIINKTCNIFSEDCYIEYRLYTPNKKIQQGKFVRGRWTSHNRPASLY